MELNPDNPLMQRSRDHWQAIVGVLMIKMGVTEVNVTVDDLEKIANLPELPTVMFRENQDGSMDLKLITRAEAAAILEHMTSGRMVS